MEAGACGGMIGRGWTGALAEFAITIGALGLLGVRAVRRSAKAAAAGREGGGLASPSTALLERTAAGGLDSSCTDWRSGEAGAVGGAEMTVGEGEATSVVG